MFKRKVTNLIRLFFFFSIPEIKNFPVSFSILIVISYVLQNKYRILSLPGENT